MNTLSWILYHWPTDTVVNDDGNDDDDDELPEIILREGRIQTQQTLQVSMSIVLQHVLHPTSNQINKTMQVNVLHEISNAHRQLL
jgi:hypothetical protein